MNCIDEDRREFLRRAAITALAFPLLVGCESSGVAQRGSNDILERLRRNAQPLGSEAMGAIEAPEAVSWRHAFDIGKDDGESMIISGTVYKSDGKTVAPNALIYFYHTDKFGIYGRAGQHKHGKYRGWMLTDSKGRYEFISVRPASYPNSTQSQHVHMTITTLDAREDWIDSILFEGDKFLTQRERESTGKRGGFNPIVTLRPNKDGVMHAVRDIQLMG